MTLCLCFVFGRIYNIVMRCTQILDTHARFACHIKQVLYILLFYFSYFFLFLWEWCRISAPENINKKSLECYGFMNCRENELQSLIREYYDVIVVIKHANGLSVSCLITVLSSVADNEEPSTSSARDTPPAKKIKVSPSVSSRSPPRARSPPRTPKTIRNKFSQAQPYSFFLTRVSGIADKFNSSFVMDIKGKITFMIVLILDISCF